MSIIRTKTMQSIDPARRRTACQNALVEKNGDYALGRTHGFSLIELLVVIAIIAILAAIIFPAIIKSQESGRRAASISNYHEISQGLARYVADHDGKYPAVLFAYSDGVHSMHAIGTAYTGNSPQYLQYMQGLYPTYVNSAATFTDADAPVQDIEATTTLGPINVNTLQIVGQNRNVLAKDPVARSFYEGDAFDVSPEIVGPNQVADGHGADPPLTLVPRYQPAWTSVMDPNVLGYTPATFGSTPVGAEGITYDEYNRQLDNPAATDDTYVTCTTYHVANGNFVVVLFKDGTAKSMDASKFLIASVGGKDTGDISADNSGVANSRFWLVQPTGTH
jgi:prepilin-type N-terminal cleavage/methylation domain-containing protein